MSVSVQFLFDFGSPNAYFCHKVIPQVEARTGVKFEYVPILLGGLFKITGNRSPAEAFAGIRNKQAYNKLEVDRFVATHGLTQYRFERYVDAMYAAMWEQQRNMSEDAQIAEVLAAAGLDAQAIADKSQDPDVKARLLANTEEAAERGAFGSPTFFVGKEIWFGKEHLRDVEEEIVRLTR